MGLTTKMLLRLVSLDFKELRPDSDPTSMHSLRVFKILLAQIPGLKRQRPRMAPRPNGNARGPRPALEIIVWIENEDEVVEGIKAGLPDDLANAVVEPDVMDNAEELESGKPQTVNVFEQESWNTTVVGPTAKEDVLQKFLQDHAEQVRPGQSVRVCPRCLFNATLLQLSLRVSVRICGAVAADHPMDQMAAVFSKLTDCKPHAMRLQLRYGTPALA